MSFKQGIYYQKLYPCILGSIVARISTNQNVTKLLTFDLENLYGLMFYKEEFSLYLMACFFSMMIVECVCGC